MNRKGWPAIAATMLLLSGCGLVDDAKEQAQKEIAAECTERTGADEQTCACVADRLGESLTLETLRGLLEAVARGENPPEMERALRSCS